MKALYNNKQQSTYDDDNSDNLIKKLIELQNMNKDKENYIIKIEKQISMLEQQSQNLNEQIQAHQNQLQSINNKQQEEKSQQQDQQQMNNWIENVQKYSGLPQQIIDSLCSLEYEGDESEICLSCYQGLTYGSMCTYLPCSHLFHKQCIGNYLKVNKTCPACQQLVEL